MKAGLLMEAAEAHQQLAAAALKRLDAATRSLDPAVREAVAQAASQAVAETARAEFAQLRGETQRTAQALQGIRGGLSWNLGVMAYGMAAVSALTVVGGVYLLGGFGQAVAAQPAPPTVLRGDPALLADLARRGVRVDVVPCGDARRVCVKVDPKAGSYGPRKDLMVLPAPSSPAGPPAP